ncbi:MAG: hypothetical protein ABI874_13815 [Chloroflexota bacterium]
MLRLAIVVSLLMIVASACAPDSTPTPQPNLIGGWKLATSD